MVRVNGIITTSSVFATEADKKHQLSRRLTAESILISAHLQNVLDQQYQSQEYEHIIEPDPAITASQSRQSSPSKSVNRMSKYSGRLICVTLATSLFVCSLPAGYNLGAVNTPEAILKNFCNQSLARQNKVIAEHQLELIWSTVVSSFLIGCIIGSSSAASLADRLGRKKATFVTAGIGIASAFTFGLCHLAQSVVLLILARVIAGIHCGICSSLTPMYLMESAPKSLRSSQGVLHCFGLTTGLLIAQLLGQRYWLGTPQLWSLMLALPGLIILVGLLLMTWTTESPTYLFINKGDEGMAQKALLLLMNEQDAADCLFELRQERKQMELCPTWTLGSVLRSVQLRRPLFLLCALHIGQQLSGINAVFYYSTATFERVGLSLQHSQMASIGAAGLNVLFSMISIPLIASFTKRNLLLISSSMSCFTLVLFAASITFQEFSWMAYVTVATMLLYVCVYGIGLGPIPYMIGADLFESGPRAIAMSLGCLCNWVSNFFVAILFPIFQKHLDQHVFLMFALCCVLLTIIVNHTIPAETSNTNSTKELTRY